MQNKKRLLLLVLENGGDRVFSVCKSTMPTEYREKVYDGVSRIKYFKCISLFDSLSIQHIPFD